MSGDSFKQKVLKKIILAIAIILALAAAALAGYGVFHFCSELEETKEELEKYKELYNELKESVGDTDDESAEEGSAENVDLNSLPEIQKGEQVQVNTEYGNFLLTVEHVRACDWVERSETEESGTGEKKAVLIECDVQNIDYTYPFDTQFSLNYHLAAADNNGNMADLLGYSFEDGEYLISPEIPNGANGKVVVPYKVNSDALGLSININNQYRLYTDIEM